MMILQQTRGNLSSGDQLALDLPFAATKSLTARVGPTPIFTRASGATYVGSDGLIHGVDTSTTSNSIGTGSKTFTLSAPAGQDQLWRTGDAVEATNGTNSMFGAVTSYDANTQVLVCNITSITGSGTFNSWRIGYRGPRFDHDPANPTVCRGLLIEEQRQNLTIRSDNFGSSEWDSLSQRNLTVTSNDTTSPSGAVDADLLTVGATTTIYQVVQRLPAISGTLTSGTAYTISCYFKPNQITRVSIYAGNLVTLPTDATFDLTGAGSIVGTPIGTPSIQRLSNGWYRCIVTGVAGATSDTTFRISPVSGTSKNYVGNSVDSFWAWGAQLEAGSFATSYIPTTTSALTRSADVCSITGANFSGIYNQSQGTLLVNAEEFRRGTSYTAFIRISETISPVANRYQIGTNGPKSGVSSPIEFIAASNSLTSYQAAPNSPTPNFKAALAYSIDDMRGSLNGVLAGADSPPSALIVGANQLIINSVGGYISVIRYYKKRLPNAKLQALTV